MTVIQKGFQSSNKEMCVARVQKIIRGEVLGTPECPSHWMLYVEKNSANVMATIASISGSNSFVCSLMKGYIFH